MKRCSQCGLLKPASAEYFEVAKRNRSGLGAWCRDCKNAKVREWKNRNLERNRLNALNWQSANPERRKEIQAKYREENRELLREKHKEYIKTERGAEIHAINGRQRRARLAGVPSERYTSVEIADRDDWTCQLCGCPIDPSAVFPEGESLSIDHVVPISKGGTDLKTNLQATHLFCNQSKGGKIE